MTSVAPQREQEENINQLSDTEPRWFAVYTRYKREKLVLKELQRRGIHAYLPLQTVTRYYTRKVKTVHLPLISCYMFVRITRSEYVPVLEVTGVLHFVRFRKDLLSIPEREIDIMRMVCGEDVQVEVTEGPMAPGDRVEIMGGRLTGMQGTLVEQSGNRRFAVALDTLGMQLRMEVPKERLKRL
jgi:transcription antitermination factor NusG